MTTVETQCQVSVSSLPCLCGCVESIVSLYALYRVPAVRAVGTAGVLSWALARVLPWELTLSALPCSICTFILLGFCCMFVLLGFCVSHNRESLHFVGLTFAQPRKPNDRIDPLQFIEEAITLLSIPPLFASTTIPLLPLYPACRISKASTLFTLFPKAAVSSSHYDERLARTFGTLVKGG